MSRKYKKPLKECKDCKYNCKVTVTEKKKESEQTYCKIFTLFNNKCERKVIRR